MADTPNKDPLKDDSWHLRHHPDGRRYAEVFTEAGVSALLYDPSKFGH